MKLKQMEESQKAAAEIRQQLEGRHHSDSTAEIPGDFDEILRAALSLPLGDRAMLADHLLTSLDGPNQKQIDEAWAEEAERRMREIDEGKVEAIDGELVMQRLRSRFKQTHRQPK
jgi:putative addiction module component (TIGR02574 family)